MTDVDPRRLRIPAPGAPDPCTAEEYEARLWAATDASLRRDPSRWTVKASGSQSFSGRARAGDEDAEKRSLGAQASYARRRAREAAYEELARALARDKDAEGEESSP